MSSLSDSAAQDARRRAVTFAIALTLDTPLAPLRYERQLLTQYEQGELTIEAVLDLLAQSVYHVFYRSQATSFLEADQLQALLEWSHTFNAAHDITGLLLYSHGRFAQVIEGPEATIHALYDRIRQDTRHQHVVTLSEGPGPHRWFADWRMAFGQLAPAELTDLLRGLEHGRAPRLPLADPQVQTLVEAFSLAKYPTR
jgi:hypothetical protein